MKLISLVDFVLEQSESIKSDMIGYGEFIDKVVKYTNFLKQPLTLGMFVACDDDGNVLVEPDNFIEGYDGEYNYDIYKYMRAKESVLFEGFEIIHSDEVRITIQYEFQQLDYNRIRERFENYNTIEDLTGCHLDLILSDSASKKFKY